MDSICKSVIHFNSANYFLGTSIWFSEHQPNCILIKPTGTLFTRKWRDTKQLCFYYITRYSDTMINWKLNISCADAIKVIIEKRFKSINQCLLWELFRGIHSACFVVILKAPRFLRQKIETQAQQVKSAAFTLRLLKATVLNKGADAALTAYSLRLAAVNRFLIINVSWMQTPALLQPLYSGGQKENTQHAALCRCICAFYHRLALHCQGYQRRAIMAVPHCHCSLKVLTVDHFLQHLGFFSLGAEAHYKINACPSFVVNKIK